MKTVLITGTSSGIGRATAAEFLRREWTVYATARNAADIAALGEAGCETAELDVTSDADVDRVVERILEETGRIDCLVNNAGYAQYGPLEDVPVDALEDQFEVNVYGPHRLTRTVLPHMRDRKTGTVVSVSSVLGRLATAGAGAYAGSKHALEAMCDALRLEVDEYGVDVVVVEPGPVRTRFGERADAELERLDRSEDRLDALARGDNLAAHEDYESVYSLIEDSSLLSSGDDVGVHPAAVATVIADAAATAHPDSRYAVGSTARLIMLARHLPDRWRDAAYRLVRWVVT
jgi:NAD(P)-dependent dehydrogenase (short-subunit alcohol dehydrogenase family)